MAEVVYVPVVQEMTEERLREFQARLDAAAQEHGWNGVFLVMRCRPAKPIPVPATHPREVP